MCSGIKGKIHIKTGTDSTRFRQKMRMEVYVSDYALGEVLSIECEDG